MSHLVARRLLCLLLVLASAIESQGNPILVVDRPNRLKSERVRIKVGKNESEVVGDYVFVALGPALKRGLPTATLEIPVILSEAIPSSVELETSAQLRVAVGGGPDGVRVWRPMQFEDGHTPPPGLPELPTGWRYAYFTYAVNFEGTAPLRVRITYRQPHLPGNLAPYLPILPNPDPAGRYEVRFEAAPGLRLEPVGKRPGQRQTRGGQTHWTVSPKHHQLLQMRVAGGQ